MLREEIEEVLECWGARVECWSCWPSAIEEVLKFRLFFCNQKNKKKREGRSAGGLTGLQVALRLPLQAGPSRPTDKT